MYNNQVANTVTYSTPRSVANIYDRPGLGIKKIITGLVEVEGGDLD